MTNYNTLQVQPKIPNQLKLHHVNPTIDTNIQKNSRKNATSV